MKTAIVCAIEEEISYLVNQLSNKQQQKIKGFEFYTGQINSKEVVLQKLGIGKVSAAIGITLLNQLFSPTHIINTGSAAGLQTVLRIGDIVVSNAVSYYDVDVTAFGYEYGQVPRMPSKFIPDPVLLKIVTEMEVAIGPTIKPGLIVSGDSFINSIENITKIKSQFPEAYALEMEAGGIAQACHQLNIPFIIFRAISDAGDQDAKLTHEEFLKLAAENSAKLVIKVLNCL
ncbi:MAG: 5'-methylthioadenosine/S-adenosylhomocysteine nucleosidase [Gammaproteobacteria bacterium RIFCSPHIGHO2_12_FULL_35_23]|nr:MAG: 5'-methylthioadenosine/S-adenosylhomocysteine nucleosidase [Gammaproteobacteria bacterium RIFCSPHIGHO2_12_FULL_35_23]